jgi:hypothetical protein
MRKSRLFLAQTMRLVLVAGISLALVGCAAMQRKDGSAPAGGDNTAKAGISKGELPQEIGVSINLEEGKSWKGRFISTGEVKRTLRSADGKETVRTRSLGLELSAVQTVKSVSNGVATIEVRETAAKILQEGKFVDVPFRRLSPPERFSFTIDMNTGKTDFSGMEKAWRDWMATVKDSPAGDILGKTFRLEGYLSQLEDLYTKPFTRLGGHRLTKEYRAIEEKDFLLPFVGPSVDLGPMPVKTELAYEGFEVRKGGHYLNVVGRYAGEGVLTPELLTERLDEFAARLPSKYESKTVANGNFRSSVDIISGREQQTDSRVTYTATATFDGQTLTEEIAAKYLLVPED